MSSKPPSTPKRENSPQSHQLQPMTSPSLSQATFFSRISSIRTALRQLSEQITYTATVHRRDLNSTAPNSSPSLSDTLLSTHKLTTSITLDIKTLDGDARRTLKLAEGDEFNGLGVLKAQQVNALKYTFKSELRRYEQQERVWRHKYRDHLGRQYRLVRPQADDQEVSEAVAADWSDEGLFQTALLSNRSPAASQALHILRSRHAAIHLIERTLFSLSDVFTDLSLSRLPGADAASNFPKDAPSLKDLEAGGCTDPDLDLGSSPDGDDDDLDRVVGAETHAREIRRLKIWIWITVVAVIVVVGVALGLYFGIRKGMGRSGLERRGLGPEIGGAPVLFGLGPEERRVVESGLTLGEDVG
ncbi:MAG: hypothetical protein M1817_004100 [Caeruleum heppii]|nr:MAG: hypothetical protein M1817_004100 [Caeruleum heppii]